MTKWDLEIAELRNAYVALQSARTAIRAEVKERHRALIAAEVAERIGDAELAFAKHLASVKERSGLPITVIQDEVLYTKTWSAWTKWRDLAGLTGERETARSAKTDTARAHWNDDFSVLTVTRGPHGEPLVDGRYVELSNFRRHGFSERLLGDFAGFESDGTWMGQAEESGFVTEIWGDWGKMFDMVAPMIQAAIESGDIPLPRKTS